MCTSGKAFFEQMDCKVVNFRENFERKMIIVINRTMIMIINVSNFKVDLARVLLPLPLLPLFFAGFSLLSSSFTVRNLRKWSKTKQNRTTIHKVAHDEHTIAYSCA